jgi:hypothetical protein
LLRGLLQIVGRSDQLGVGRHHVFDQSHGFLRW